MPRLVDTLPTPKDPLDVKVVVLSYSRNGTLGLYTALSILGYKSYHVVEIFKNGPEHMELVTEAMYAARTGKGRFTKGDFDKWLGRYDAIVEMACFDLLDDIVASYPNAKFILTSRDPEAWMTSMENTIVPAIKSQYRFPDIILHHFDRTLRGTYHMSDGWRYCFFPGGNLNDREGAMKKYQAHNDRVRELVSPDRLLDVKLEDGLGWEQVCTFLGHDIPDVPYPRINEAGQFKKIQNNVHGATQMKVAKKMLSIMIPSLAGFGFVLWYLRRK